MTNEEFREKWSGLSINHMEMVDGVAAKLVVSVVESLEYMDVVEMAEAEGWHAELAEAAYDLLSTPLARERLEALFTL